MPITLPPKLPNYVLLDPRSQWHVSGLLSTAFESMTLPSRLRAREGFRQTLDGLGNTLNVNGNQNIAKLRMSIEKDSLSLTNGHSHSNGSGADAGATNTSVHNHDDRMRDAGIQEDHEPEDPRVFDMEFFPVSSPSRYAFKRTHVFGQAENYRGNEHEQNTQASDVDEGLERARRRAAGDPMISR